MKLSGYHQQLTTRRISDFGDLTSFQLCDLPMSRQWEKTVPCFAHQIDLAYPEWRYISQALMIQTQILSGDLH